MAVEGGEFHNWVKEQGLERPQISEAIYGKLDPKDLETFSKLRVKRLGFSIVEPRDSVVLITAAHGGDRARVESVEGELVTQAVEELNAKAGEGERYIQEDGKMMIGRNILHMPHRESREYRSDTNAGICAVETTLKLEEEGAGLAIFEFPQRFIEPNKTDTSKEVPIINMSVLESLGLKEQFERYVQKFGAHTVRSGEWEQARRGRYLVTETEDGSGEMHKSKRELLAALSSAVVELKTSENEEGYQRLGATLLGLKMLSNYYEEQIKMLRMLKGRYPIGLEIHTAYDRLREGVDVVIGSRMGASVSDPEAEILLALVFKRHGLNANISTLTSDIPKQENLKSALNSYLDTLIAEIVPEEEREELLEVNGMKNNRQELMGKLQVWTERRLEALMRKSQQGIGREGSGRGILEVYLEKKGKLEKDVLQKLALMGDDELVSLTMKVILSKAEEMEGEDLFLFVKQFGISAVLGDDIHYDYLTGGLSGLNTLKVKHDAMVGKDSHGEDKRPQVFQIEVVKNIMTDNKKREIVQEALAEYVRIVGQEGFEPKKALKEFVRDST